MCCFPLNLMWGCKMSVTGLTANYGSATSADYKAKSICLSVWKNIFFFIRVITYCKMHRNT